MESVPPGREESPDSAKQTEVQSSAVGPIIRNLVMQSPVSTFVVDRENRIVFLNPACQGLFRVAADSSSDGSAGILLDEELRRHGVIAKMRSVFKDGIGITIVHEYDSTETVGQGNPPGGHKYLRARIFPIKGATGEVDYVVVQHEDRTERHESRQALLEERDRAQRYLDVVGVIVVVIDADQRIGLLNRRGSEVLGYAEEEIIGKNWFDCCIPEAEREQIRAVFASFIAGEAEMPEYFENLVLTKGGEERLISWRNIVLRDDTGRVTSTLSSGEDITERKRIRQALETSQANYQAIFDAANDAILLHNAENGEILDVNRRMCEMYGYSIEEARRVNVEALSSGVPPYTQSDAMTWILKAIEGEPQLFEWQARHRDGHLFWVEVNLKRTTIGGQKRLLAVVRDITERKQAEEARASLQAHYEEQQKQFYRQNILAATGGKLVICDQDEIDAAGGAPVCISTLLTPADARGARHRLENTAMALGMSSKKAESFALCIGEAATNALKHAGGGEVALYTGPGKLLVRITDHGGGMDALILPRATLELGYSSGHSLGMGYAVVLALADRVLLHTGPTGTSVVIEMDLVASEIPDLDALPDTW